MNMLILRRAFFLQLLVVIVLTVILCPQNAMAATKAPVRVGGDIMSTKLIKQMKPIYPALAKAARVQGTVKLDVKISTGGTIEDIKLISGPPLLVQAALNAVNTWMYKPYLVDGKPVEVLTTVNVNFTLSQ